MRHYRQAHFIPRISLRQPYEQWQEAGSEDAAQRANKRCRALLESYAKPVLETAVSDELYNFVEQRKGQLP